MQGLTEDEELAMALAMSAEDAHGSGPAESAPSYSADASLSKAEPVTEDADDDIPEEAPMPSKVSPT